MAVAFDVSAVDAPSNFGVTSCTTASFTIAAADDRAALLVLAMGGNGSTSFSSSCAGTAGSAVSGADSGSARTPRILAHQVLAPATGSQTATMSWTTAQDAVLMALVCNGVDPSAPFVNGATTDGATGAPSITPSGSGANNLSFAALNAVFTPASPSQTTRVANKDNGSHVCTATSGAAGAAHSWADGFGVYVGLAVHVQEPQLPVISLEPVDQTVADGATASFDTTVSNATTLQWEVLAADGSGGWASVSGGSGGTTADYTTPTLTTSDRGKQYRLKASNANGDVYSHVVVVRITSVPTSYDGSGFVVGANS